MRENLTSPTLVSIGVPVYNGEPYLEEALRAIANQTYADFEVIISDNASTDATADICDLFTSTDDRFRVVRHEENLDSPRPVLQPTPKVIGNIPRRTG